MYYYAKPGMMYYLHNDSESLKLRKYGVQRYMQVTKKFSVI